MVEIAMNYSASKDGDYFGFVYEDTSSRVLTITTWGLVSLLGSPLLAGIISFKRLGSLNYQTLIDKLSAFQHAILLTFCLSTMHVILLRNFFKMPGFVCSSQLVLWYACIMILCLIGLESNVLRYLYLCVWKNIGKLNDDLFGAFFIIMNTSLGVIYGCVLFITKGYLGLDYAMCVGSDPSEVLDEHEFGETLAIVLILIVCGLNAAILLTINYKTRKGNPVWKSSSLFDMRHSVEALMFVGIGISIVLRVYLRYMFVTDQLTKTSPLVITASQRSIQLAMFVLHPISVYAGNNALRRHVFRAICDTTLVHKLAEIGRHMTSKVQPQN